MDSDHTRYDRPEDEEDRRGKAFSYLIGGIVVMVLLYLIATGQVPGFGS